MAMEGCREIQKGTLSIKGRGILGKSWSPKWCMLYCASNSNPPRLQIYDSKEQFEKDPQSCKTISLEECSRINKSVRVTSKGEEYMFELVSKKEKHSFSASSENELMDWILGMNSVISGPERDDIDQDGESCENVMYESHEKPLTFTVDVSESESPAQCNLSGKYLLMVFRTSIALAEISTQKIVLSIQLRHIRRFSNKNSVFQFETGRSSGCEGCYYLSSKNSREIYSAVNKNSKLNRELPHTILGSRLSENVPQTEVKTPTEGRPRTQSASSTQSNKTEMRKTHSHGVVGSETLRNKLRNVVANAPKAEKDLDEGRDSKSKHVKKSLEKSHSVEGKKGDKKMDRKSKKEIEKEEKRLEKEEKRLKKEKKKSSGKEKKESVGLHLEENTYDDIKDPLYAVDEIKSSYKYDNFSSSNKNVPIYSEPDDFTPATAKTETSGNVYSDVKTKTEAWKQLGMEDEAIHHKENFEKLKVASAEKAASDGDYLIKSDLDRMSDDIDDDLYDHLQRDNNKHEIPRKTELRHMTNANSAKSENVQLPGHIYGMASAKPLGHINNNNEYDQYDYYTYEDIPVQNPTDLTQSKVPSTADTSYEECIPKGTATQLENDDEDSTLYDEIS